jgi:hypothetical protein
MEDTQSTNIGIVAINEIEYSHVKFQPESFNSDNLVFGFQFGLNPDYETNQIGILLDVSYNYTLAENGNFKILNLKLETIFSVSDLSITFDENSDNPFHRRNEELLATLLGIALSTFRGYLYLKSAGTSVREFFFPILNPLEIIKDIKD